MVRFVFGIVANLSSGYAFVENLMMTADALVAGFVLAGGESRRMGRDKAMIELGGLPMLLRTAGLVRSVVGSATLVGRATAYRGLGLSAVEDDWPGCGPLGGIATALRRTASSWALVLACDLPYLTGPWLEFLVARALASEADAVLPMNVLGTEPLCAMYHRRCETGIRAALERGSRKVADGLAGLCLDVVQPAEWKAFDPEGLLFKNMNSPADFEEAKARLG